MNEPAGFACYIDGRNVDPEQVAPPAMNYGQHSRWSGRPRVAYAYAAPVPVFLARMSPWFERYRRELRADLSRHPADTPDEAAFAALGYPALAAMLSDHGELAVRILLDHALELNLCFAPARSSRVRYAANSVDSLAIEGASVRFGGVAYDMDGAGRGTG